MPFLIAGLTIIHLSLLHKDGSNNPLGIKGAGEAGAIGAPPAVINAVCDALNIDHIDMPAKPEKVWQILSSNKSIM